MNISKAFLRIGIDARLWSQSGVGRYTRNLVMGIDKRVSKNNYSIFLNKNDFDKASFKNKNIKKILCDIPWHSFSEQLEFPKILERENLDLVHFPYFSIPIFYKKPYIITIHDLIIDHFPTGKASSLPYPIYFIKKAGYKIIFSKAIKNSKKIIAPSNATKEEIISHFNVNPDKIKVIYEAGFTDSKIKADSSINIKDFFLYVGNAYPHKNLENLIKAFDLFILENNISVKLVLVGKDDFFYRKIKQNVKNKEIGKNIIFFGEANDDELKSLYKNARALIVPSFMEGFGLTTVEAMSQKCVVITSSIPSLSEICEKAAVYFNPDDPFDIKEKIKMVYNFDEKQKSELINLGIKQSQNYSWDKMIDETVKIYESCIGV